MLTSRFYAVMCAIMWLMALAGFGPGYVKALTTEGFPLSYVVHLHAVVYVGWLVLFTVQANLPSLGRTDWHRRLGGAMALYAVPMFIIGMWVSFSQFAMRVEAGDLPLARTMLLPPFTDMLVFPFLFGYAVAQRRQPERHKRLMVVTTTMLLVAAAMRVPFFGTPPPLLPALAIWLTPIAVGLWRDWVVERQVHVVYGVAIVAMPIFFFRVLLTESALWIGFTDWVIESFLR